MAAKNADVEAMRVLLQAGADPTMPNLENTTPLMVAAGVYIYHPGEDGGSLPGDANEVLEAVKICVEHGNDVDAVDALGYTALHGAAFRGLPAVVEYLVEQGAKLDARTHVYDTDLKRFLRSRRGCWRKAWVDSARNCKRFELRGLLHRAAARGGGATQPDAGARSPTEGERIDPVTCLDCIQTHAPVRAAFQEREKKIDALAAETLGAP